MDKITENAIIEIEKADNEPKDRTEKSSNGKRNFVQFSRAQE